MLVNKINLQYRNPIIPYALPKKANNISHTPNHL